MENKISQLIRQNIRSLIPYSSAREEYTVKDGIFLDANENPFGIYNRYPDPYQLAIKQRLGLLKNINPNKIFIGNGSDEIIDLAYRIFCKPGIDKALTFSPTYGMYEVLANINDIEIITCPLNKNFQIDRYEVNTFLSDTNLKLIFICSPNNPTGNLLNQQDIEYILENFAGVVILDEAYIDFCPEASLLSKLATYPRLIISQTLSKAWGLAGIRMGIAYMNEELLSYYNKVKAPYNISEPNQQAALAHLNDIENYQSTLSTILAEKERLAYELRSVPSILKVYPSDANFFLVEVNNANSVYQQLVKGQVIVRNRHSVINNCLRITVGTSNENEKLITILNEIS
jgi:histidinol-phosphate aminotransferase